MRSLYPMADLITLLGKVDDNVKKLNRIYTNQVGRNLADDELIPILLAEIDAIRVQVVALETAALDP